MRNKRHRGEQWNTALTKWDEAEQGQGQSRREQSDELPATGRERQVRDGSPKKSPQIGGEADRDDGGGSGNGEPVPRQDEGQRDRGEAVTDTVGQDEEEKCESRGCPGFAHRSTQAQRVMRGQPPDSRGTRGQGGRLGDASLPGAFHEMAGGGRTNEGH